MGAPPPHQAPPGHMGQMAGGPPPDMRGIPMDIRGPPMGEPRSMMGDPRGPPMMEPRGPPMETRGGCTSNSSQFESLNLLTSECVHVVNILWMESITNHTQVKRTLFIKFTVWYMFLQAGTRGRWMLVDQGQASGFPWGEECKAPSPTTWVQTLLHLRDR